MNSASEPSLEVARHLVRTYGWNATCHQIINPGINHWFAPHHDAVVGYVEHGGVRVVAGAPVCPFGSLPKVVEEFENEAARRGLSVCYFGAEARLESVLRNRSTHSMLPLGAQPAWHPSSWHTRVTSHASLRAQFNRARNKGVVVEEWPPDRATGNPALRRVLDQWLSTRGLPPLHFLVEPNTLERLEERRVFVAIRRGDVVAFLVASPVPCRHGHLVEQSIRGQDAPNGTVELLIDAAVRAAVASGEQYITLGLSPLSRAALNTHDWKETPIVMRGLLAWVRAHGSRFYNFVGLDTFKHKFHPEWWEPVFAIANTPRFSYRSLYAIAAAFTGGHPVTTVLRGARRAIASEAGWLLRGHR